MQYNNPKFNVGDVLVCVDAERSGLTLGAEYLATYAKKSTKDTNGGMITLGDGRVYFGKRFVLKSTLTNKEQAMNSMVVSDLTPKKQRKLAALLVSKGYECSGDLNLKPNLLVRFNAKSFCVNFGSYNGGVSRRTYIVATDKKYKAILAEVLAALPVETPEPVEEPKLELKVGATVKLLRDSGASCKGAVGTIKETASRCTLRVQYLDDYWYPTAEDCVVVPRDTPLTRADGSVPLELTVGTKVRCVSTNNPEYFAVGAVGVWGDHRKITFTNDSWYKAGAELEVVPDDTPVTTDQGVNPDLPLTFEVGCTVERTKNDFQGMTVGDVDIVTVVHSDGVRLNKYQRGTGYHDTANLKVIKGAITRNETYKEQVDALTSI